MTAAARLGALLACAVLVACAKPVVVHVAAAGPASAQLGYRRIDGEAGNAAARECPTPCSLSFEPDSVYELELRASGYQRARVAVEYDTMRLFQLRSDGPEPTLVIPMLEAPAATQ